MRTDRFRALIEDVLISPLKEYDRGLQDQIGRIRVQYSDRPPQTRRGMIVSAARYEIESRARLIYKATIHVLERTCAQPDLAVAEEARFVVRALIERECTALVTRLREYFEEPMDEEAKSFQLEAEERAREHSAQAELFVAGLPRLARPSGSGAPSMTFNGPVGAVQTGDRAVANIHQVIVPPEVTTALQQITDHFQDRESAESRRAVAVVEEVHSELQSAQPNRLKIAGAATALGSLIQTVAALQPAYHTLRTFLHTIGITIP
jgi:hypothetical protein